MVHHVIYSDLKMSAHSSVQDLIHARSELSQSIEIPTFALSKGIKSVLQCINHNNQVAAQTICSMLTRSTAIAFWAHGLISQEDA